MVGNTQSVLPRGWNIIDFVECHYRLGLQVKGTPIPIEDLERLETRDVAASVLQILGNISTPSHHEGGGGGK